MNIKMIFAVVISIFMVTNTSFAKDVSGKVIAQVGPYKLTVDDFEKQVKTLPPQFQMAIASNKQLRESFLERWVQITLMALKAREMKLDQDPQVKKRLEDLKNALLAQEFSKRFIEDKVTISDEEVKEYYEKHKDQFTQKEQVKARHILVKVPAGANEDEWKKARKKALDIKARAEKGEDFAKLAKEFSDDPGTKNRGGELGYFGKGRMVPEFEKVAFSLEPGVISDPVKTIFGWHLIQVEDKKASQVKPLEDVKSFVRQRALQEKKSEMLEKLLADVEKKYSVKINKEVLDEIKIDPPRFSGMVGSHGFLGGGHGMPRGH